MYIFPSKTTDPFHSSYLGPCSNCNLQHPVPRPCFSSHLVYGRIPSYQIPGPSNSTVRSHPNPCNIREEKNLQGSISQPLPEMLTPWNLMIHILPTILGQSPKTDAGLRGTVHTFPAESRSFAHPSSSRILQGSWLRLLMIICINNNSSPNDRSPVDDKRVPQLRLLRQ